MMASKENFDPLANLKPYQGESFDAPTTSLGQQQTGDKTSLKNLLEDYGWVLPAVGIPAVAAYGGKKLYDLYSQKPDGGGPSDGGGPPPGEGEPKKRLQDRFIGQPSTPPGPQTSIEKQLGGLDINSLPKDQRELINTLNDAERKRMAKQQQAQNIINDEMKGKIPTQASTTPTILGQATTIQPIAPISNPQTLTLNIGSDGNIITPASGLSTPEVPTVSDIGKQAVGVAPVAAPATVQQVATEAIAPPDETVEKKKSGRKEGTKNRTPEQIALDESIKGRNMYLNMFGYEPKDPTSPKSLAAIQATDRFINEALGGKLPASRDPLLNPAGDVAPSGKKFYSGTPEGYRNAYIPWVQENLNTLAPETQSHVLKAMTKGQTSDLNKVMKGLGMAGLIGATGAAFAGPSQTRTRDIRNAIGEALLPLGISPSELQPGTLTEAQLRAFQEAQKLGSPYRSVPPPR